MQYFGDVPVWGDPVDTGALQQILRSRSQGVRAAMMADHHKGYGVPIGGVVAYDGQVSPSGVGYDIGCGNKAVRLEVSGHEIAGNIAGIMDDVFSTISFGVGQRNTAVVDHALFDDDVWKLEATGRLKELAREQLGSVGSGNHFVDIFVDETDRVWIGVHLGSRGFGHKTATWFLRKGRASDDMDAMPLVLDVDHPLGADYLAAMNLAGRYAYAGRAWICDRVAKIIGAPIVESIHNHHNFAWLEEHHGQVLWVVRKGATPAFPGQKSFIGGSLGDFSAIVESVDHTHMVPALYSTIHGAGRVMGRRAAAGKWKHGKCIRPGLVTPEMLQASLDKTGVELRGAGLDEAPQCYKRIETVLEQQDGIRVLHWLTPIGVAMAGAHEYKHD